MIKSIFDIQLHHANAGSYPYHFSFDIVGGADFNLGRPVQRSMFDYPGVIRAIDTGKPKSNGAPAYKAGTEMNYAIASSNISVSMGVYYSSQFEVLTQSPFQIEFTNNLLNTKMGASSVSQFITSHSNVTENVRTISYSVPLLLKFKHRIARRMEIGVDGGLLLNIGSTRTYVANAAFDYEAIYNYINPKPNAAGGALYLLDSATGSYTFRNPSTYFDSLNMKGHGFNVGLNKKPNNLSGAPQGYDMAGSLGYMFRIQGIYHIKPAISFLFGCTLSKQKMGRQQDLNTTKYYITNLVGEYNPLSNGIGNAGNIETGVNIGLRFMIRDYRHIASKSLMDSSDLNSKK